MVRFFLYRFERWLTSLTSVDIIGAGVMIATVYGATVAAFGATTANPSASVPSPSPTAFGWWPIIAIAFLTLVVLAMRAIFEFKRRTYDPTWALKFDEMFMSDEMLTARARAAMSLSDEKNNLRDPALDLPYVNDVLDFFETIGFYVHGQQISAEVAHQHFFYWLQFYYQMARDYIELLKSDDPTTWEYVEELYFLTNEIERRRSKGKATEAVSAHQIALFVLEEAGGGRD